MPAQRKKRDPNVILTTYQKRQITANRARQFSPFGSKERLEKMDPEARKEWHRKGGLAAQENNKRRRTLTELMKTFLAHPINIDVARQTGLDNLFPETKAEEITYGMLLTASVAMKGIYDGSANQYTVIRDTIGEKPRTDLALTGAEGQPLNPPTVNVLFNDACKKEDQNDPDKRD